MNEVTTFPNAPQPTAAELRARKNVFVQLYKFALLNFKMIVMVQKGHH